MKHLYFDVEHWGTINVIDLGPWMGTPTCIIQGVEVHPKYRSQGVARALMKQVLEDADAEGQTLVLSVTHQTEEHRGGLSFQQLWDWYSRCGFEPWTEGDMPEAMIRRPRLAVNA